MSIFTDIKAAVTTRQAAEFYGLKVSRNGMACCPFHNDRHPSMKVDERYYCFGCHETGDVIDFVGKLFGLTPYEAAKRLAFDFHIDPNTPVPAAQRVPRYRANDPQETECMRILTDYERMLRDWQATYAPACPEADMDKRFVEASRQLPEIEALTDVFFQPDADARKQLADELTKDGTISRLKEKMEKEGAYGDEQYRAAA